jgi:hypothetical protein
MNKARTLSYIETVISGGTTVRNARRALERAEAAAGIRSATVIDEADLRRLLEALAAEGGVIQQNAEQIARWREGGSGPVSAAGRTGR